MKKSITVLFIALNLIVCSSSTAQELLNIDVSKSQIKWIGEYTFYFGGHDGTIDFKEGYFIKTGELITGGEFIIDMTSIKCDDIKNSEANESLINHLKDPEFFDVYAFRFAKLSITNVTYHDATSMKIEADLTIKGTTLPIDFQAEVDFDKKQMFTRFKIDRMRWNVSYNGKLRNGAISDAIGFEVKLCL